MKNIKPYSKEYLHSQMATFYRRRLCEPSVVFDNLKNGKKDGFFGGHIKVSPRYASYPIFCKYEAKIARLLGNAGFAVKEVSWKIKTTSDRIGFTVFANEINY